MLKENGRKSKPRDMEFASKRLHAMKCIRCGSVEHVDAIQFGEKYSCSECGGTLTDYHKFKHGDK